MAERSEQGCRYEQCHCALPLKGTAWFRGVLGLLGCSEVQRGRICAWFYGSHGLNGLFVID